MWRADAQLLGGLLACLLGGMAGGGVQALDCLLHGACAHRGEPLLQFNSCFVRLDWCALCHNHRASIERRRHMNHAHAADLIAAEDCPLHRSSAAVSRQQRAVQIDSAPSCQREHRGSEDLTVVANDEQIGRKLR